MWEWRWGKNVNPQARQRLGAARARAIKAFPYLRAAILALVPVETPGLGTLAVDRDWRLYYDPDAIRTWSTSEVAGVLVHEVWHLLRRHAERSPATQVVDRVAREHAAWLWNAACDAEINDDLVSAFPRTRPRLALPGKPYLPADTGKPEGELAEVYYEALREREREGSRQGAKPRGATAPGGAPGRTQGGSEGEASPTAQGGPGDSGDNGASEGRGDGQSAPQGQGRRASPTPNPDGGRAGDVTASGRPAGQNPAGGPGRSGNGEGESKEDSTGTDGRSGSAGDDRATTAEVGPKGAGGGPPGSHTSPTHGATPGGSASPASAGDVASRPAGSPQNPAPGRGRCGSCATGVRAPWEAPAPDDREDTPPGVGKTRAEAIRRQVAEAIARAFREGRARGTIPGGWRRWAEVVVTPPRTPWYRILAAVVRQEVGRAGAHDYTYTRPSRRVSVTHPVMLPALRAPQVTVGVVVDTSGSIADMELGRSLEEVLGITRTGLTARRGVYAVVVDAMVQWEGWITSPHQLSRRLTGGGGTDMRVGIEAVCRHCRPAPDVVIVFTDGATPWPSRPPRCWDGSRPEVIVVLWDGDSRDGVPTWVRRVVEVRNGD